MSRTIARRLGSLGLLALTLLLAHCASEPPRRRLLGLPRVRSEAELCQRINLYADGAQSFPAYASGRVNRQIASLARKYQASRAQEWERIAAKQREYNSRFHRPFDDSMCRGRSGEKSSAGTAAVIAPADFPKYRSDPDFALVLCEEWKNTPKLEKAADAGVSAYAEMLPELERQRKQIEAAYVRRYKRTFDYQRCEN